MEAKLIAAPMVIVVAFTGITSLLTPKINPATIMIRFVLLFLASNLGLFGFYWIFIFLNPYFKSNIFKYSSIIFNWNNEISKN